MSTREAMNSGAAAVATAVRRIDPDTELTGPTPCTDFDLRTLVNHALGTTGALARLARKQGLDPEDPWGSRTDATGGDWPSRFAEQLEATAAAWDDPAAWDGSVDLGGGDQPATVIGEMTFVEVMIHGWDVARAAGQRPEVSEEVGSELLKAAGSSAELGRRMGAYGPEVDVVSSSDFDRALGVTGRDPSWAPPA
jgi:uncharacterized protein (TIGR03086 family)